MLLASVNSLYQGRTYLAHAGSDSRSLNVDKLDCDELGREDGNDELDRELLSYLLKNELLFLSGGD
jgi:hypothetical protein